MAVILTNNATSLLAGAITAGSTTLSIENADASKFPNPPAGDWFPLTIVDGAGNMEIMKATKREGAILTVTRAQEGTTAKAFAAGARLDLRLTTAAIYEIVPTMIGASTIDNENIGHENARFSWWDVGTKALKFATWAGLVAKLLPKTGGALTGQLKGMDATTAEDYLTSFIANSAGGAYANVPKRRVPFKVQATTIGNTYAPVLNASYDTSAWGGVWSQGVINLGNNAQATSYQLIHMHNDGQAQKTWTFDGKNGNFIADGVLFAAGAQYQTNGNIVGTIWQNWGASDAFTAISARIELRAQQFADDRLSQAKAYAEDRSYWRTRDYLLGEHVPVGGYAFLSVQTNFGARDLRAGGDVQWASVNAGFGAVGYGTWQASGAAVGGNRNSVWKRIG